LQNPRAYRLRCVIDPGGARAIHIEVPHDADGKQTTTVRYRDGAIELADKKASLALDQGEDLVIELLVDHSVCEVYANGRACFSRVIPLGERHGDVRISAVEAGAQLKSAEMRPVKSIWAKAGSD
jgi:hypothetical protein